MWKGLLHKPTIEQIYYWNIVLVAISLPWPMVFSNYLIGLLGIVWILTGQFKTKWQQAKSNATFILTGSIVYLLSLYGMLFTDNINNGLFLLEKRLSLLLLPIIILSSPILARNRINGITLFFAWSCVAAMTYSIGIASVKFLELYLHGYINQNIYTTNLLVCLKTSHVYFGLYLVFAFIVFTVNFFTSDKTIGKTVLYLFVTVYILLFLVLITAKMALIVGFIVFSTYVLTTQERKKSFKYVTILLIGLYIVVNTMLSLNNNVYKRIKELTTLSNISTIENDERNYSATRIAPWKCSIKLIESYGILGLGTGDTQISMNNWYKSHGLSSLVEYESHNQYLNIVLTFGLLGIACYLFCMIWSFHLSISEQYPLYLLFLLIIYISCLTENVFDLNKGIVFYSLFNSLFLSYSKSI